MRLGWGLVLIWDERVNSKTRLGWVLGALGEEVLILCADVSTSAESLQDT